MEVPVQSTRRPRPAADPHRPESPRPPRRAARLVVVCLVASAAVSVLDTVVAIGNYEGRIVAVTHGSPDVLVAYVVHELLALLAPADTVIGVLAALRLLTLVGTAAAFVTWLVLARRNAVRLGGAPRWAPAWAVGGWFVPVANLVIPYLVVRDVWRASDPSDEPAVTVPEAPVRRWWTALISTVFLHGVAAVYLTERLAARPVTYPLWCAGTAALVATAVLTGRVVLRTTGAQRELVARPGRR